MSQLVLILVVVSIIGGVAIKLILDHNKSRYEITWLELGVVGLIVVPLISWGGVTAGWNIAKSNALSFTEYWNGYELDALDVTTTCSKNGPCIQTYSCDPVYHTHTRSVSDGDGGFTTETYTETHWSSCPYATVEHTFIVETTLGDYTIARGWFTENPQEWRAGSGIPGSVSRGQPEFWVAARNRIDADNPGPVTRQMEYDNYILASDKTILNEFSSAIDTYLAEDLLPDMQSEVHSFYYADKIAFVGFVPTDAQAWQDAVMYLNAALGGERQGDLHVVLINDPLASENSDRYITALKAYWTDQDVFGDNSLSKNAVLVVLGTDDGETISWARATTGMPIGNEAMTLAIRNQLPGTALTPDAVIGIVDSELYTKVKDDGTEKPSARGVHGSSGQLERILWGLDNPTTAFTRISMSGDDADDVGTGFLHLDALIEPSGGEKFFIGLVAFLLSGAGWFAAVFIGDRTGYGQSRRRGY